MQWQQPSWEKQVIFYSKELSDHNDNETKKQKDSSSISSHKKVENDYFHHTDVSFKQQLLYH